VFKEELGRTEKGEIREVNGARTILANGGKVEKKKDCPGVRNRHLLVSKDRSNRGKKMSRKRNFGMGIVNLSEENTWGQRNLKEKKGRRGSSRKGVSSAVT